MTICVKIDNALKQGIPLPYAAREAWRISPNNIGNIDRLVAIQNQTIIKVYDVVGTYLFLSGKNEGRYGFELIELDENQLKKYQNQDLDLSFNAPFKYID